MTNQEAIKTLKENVCLICAYGGKNIDECDIRYCDNREALNVAIEALENQKIGHWIDDGKYGTSCSICGKWYNHPYLTKEEVIYCCRCGAKMEGSD